MNALPLSINTKHDQKEARNLFLYATAKTVSVFGTSIYQFALGLYVLKLTGSGLSFAITLMLGTIPMVLINPFAGVIADKVNKKRLVVSMDLISGLLLIFVYFLSQLYGLTLILIYATTFLMTVFSTFFGIGLEAAKPNIVSERKLMNINSISKIIDSISAIMGPMLGGIVYAFIDMRTFIIFNGVTFILSGISIMFIHFGLFQISAIEGREGSKINFMQDIKEGFRYLLSRKSIIQLFTIFTALNFFLSFAVTVPLPYIMNTVLELSPKEFGIVQGSFPVGLIIGAIFVKKILSKYSYQTLLTYLCYILSFFMILSGGPVWLKSVGIAWNSVYYLGYYSFALFCFGFIIALIDIPMAYLLQKEIPDEFRGRVLSIGMSIGKTMVPISMLLSGILLNQIPTYILPIAGGFIYLLFNMIGFRKQLLGKK